MGKTFLLVASLSACMGHESSPTPAPVAIERVDRQPAPAAGTGTVRGVVTDRDGKGLANRRVELRRTN